MQALNKILKHVGYADAEPFTEELVGEIEGFKGKYTGVLLPFSPRKSSHSTSKCVAEGYLIFPGRCALLTACYVS